MGIDTHTHICEMSTQDLQWLLVRKSNSFLVKQKGLGRVFSREPGNVASLHSYKHSSLVNDKGVGIVPAENRVASRDPLCSCSDHSEGWLAPCGGGGHTV